MARMERPKLDRGVQYSGAALRLVRDYWSRMRKSKRKYGCQCIGRRPVFRFTTNTEG